MKGVIVFILALACVCLAAEQTAVLSVEGMTCSDCVNKVTTALKSIEGVKDAHVTLVPGSARIVFDNGTTSSEALIGAVVATGYKARVASAAVDLSAKAQIQPIPTLAKEVPAQQGAPQTAKSGCAKTCQASAKKVSGSSGAPSCAAMAKGLAVADPSPATSKPEAPTAQGQSPAEAPPEKPAPAGSVEGREQACPTVTQCKELIEFHNAMRPLHEALSASDFETVRLGYPLLADRAVAVKKMVCDEKCVTDVGEFKDRRGDLVKSVKKLGKAVKGDNNEKLADAFNKMHEDYIKVAELAR